MKTGKLFTDICERLLEERLRGKELMYEFNHTCPSEIKKRKKLIREISASVGENVWIEPLVYLSYGNNIHIGKSFYANFNFTIVDDYTVTIGDNILIIPNVTITVTDHSVHHELRKSGEISSSLVTIGNSIWIGNNIVISPGIAIGDSSVIGAESIVTKDTPADAVAVGVPCRALRTISERDEKYYYQNYRVDPLF